MSKLLCAFACLCMMAGTALAYGDDAYGNGRQQYGGGYAQPQYGTYSGGSQYTNYNNYSSPGYNPPGYRPQNNYDDRQSGNAGWPTLGNTGGRPSKQRSGGSMLR